MTITSPVSRVDALGNGSATSFSFSPAVITQASDLEVWLLDNLGNQTLLSQGLAPPQYVVNVPGYPGTGTITYPGFGGIVLPSGWKLVMKQRAPLLQQFQPQNQGPFLASAYGGAFDYATMNDQNLQEQINRGILAAETDPAMPLVLPTEIQRANQLLGFDGAGNPIAAQPSSALVSSAMQPIVDAVSVTTALTLLGGTVGGPISVKSYGATGNGSTDDTAAMQAAITAAIANGFELYIPDGSYLIKTTLTITGTIKITGGGRISAIIVLGTNNMAGFTLTGTLPVKITDIEIMPNSGITGTTAIVISGSAVNTESVFRDLQIIGCATGINTQTAAGWVIDSCQILNFTSVGILVRNTVTPDEGDSTISNCYIQGATTGAGACIQQQSSGGLKIVGNKMITAQYGYVLILDAGVNTSDLMITGCSLENFSVSAIALTQATSTGTFGLVTLTGNQINLTPEAVGVTNTTPGWLYGLSISGNTVNIAASGIAFGIDGVTGFSIGPNVIEAQGSGVTAVVITSVSSDGDVSIQTGVGLTTYATNNSATTVVAPRVQRGTFSSTTTTPDGALYGAVSSTAVVYATPFLATPTVTLSVTGGSGAVNAIVTSSSATGFSASGIGTANSQALTFSYVASGN